MTGATTSSAGISGLVPAPAAGAATRYLRSDGIWQVPPNTIYKEATTSTAGIMSAADKVKLDGIASGAQVNTVTGIKGNAESSYRIGNVNLTPTNIGAAAASHTHDDRYYTESEVDTLISQISTRLGTVARYIGVYQQSITLAGNGEFFQAIPSEWQNGGYFYVINCSGNSLNFIANMENYNMAVKNLNANTLSTTVQVYCFSIGV